MKSFDSFRFMSNSLSSLLNKIFKAFRNNKCKDCKYCRENIRVEDNQ